MHADHVPLFVALTHVVQENVVLERVGDEPLWIGVVSTVLDSMLLLGQLEELLRRGGLGGGHHQETCCKQRVKERRGGQRRRQQRQQGPAAANL